MNKINTQNRRLDWAKLFTRGALVGAISLAALGCEEREDKWNASLGYSPTVVGLQGSVAIQDSSLDRMLFVTSPAGLKVETKIFPTGVNVTSVEASQDSSRLFVLSRGVSPRINKDDEAPQLQVFTGGTEPQLEKTFELDVPMGKLAIDPQGEWVVAYEGDATVTNPNELVLLSLTDEGAAGVLVSKTIRSFGGSPEELIFTDALTVPQGSARRFMIVRTDRDLTLVDLENLDNDEVTIKLPETDDGIAYAPLQVVYDEGDPEDTGDSRMAVRLQDSSDVVLIELGPSEDTKKDFAVVVNIVDVGGIPSAIDFVRTDGGLRLAALVPASSQATLVDPTTTLAEKVDLTQPFSKMTRITDSISEAPSGGDVALLYGSSRQIAFWSLGSTSSTPYRSVDANELAIQVTSVLDVPAPFEHLKVLTGEGENTFFVLDLEKRESFPLDLKGGVNKVQVSLDGERLWVTGSGSNNFSSVQLADLHPLALYVNPGVSRLFDIEQAAGGRAAVALHLGETWAATLLNAEAPKSHETSYYPALALEGLQ